MEELLEGVKITCFHQFILDANRSSWLMIARKAGQNLSHHGQMNCLRKEGLKGKSMGIRITLQSVSM